MEGKEEGGKEGRLELLNQKSVVGKEVIMLYIAIDLHRGRHMGKEVQSINYQYI